MEGELPRVVRRDLAPNEDVPAHILNGEVANPTMSRLEDTSLDLLGQGNFRGIHPSELRDKEGQINDGGVKDDWSD